MLEVQQLTRTFGSLQAVRSVSFSVKKGEAVGFLGPNGAGKTTTFRLITGSLGCTSGEVIIGGHHLHAEPITAKRLVGYMPESVPLYGEMTTSEYLHFRAELKGLKRKAICAECQRVTELTQITTRAETRIAHLSKGLRQRVGLADALLGNPPLLLLDEPTAGLDPNQVLHFRDLVQQLAEDHALLLSTHVLSEVEAVCQRAIVIHEGRVVSEGTLDSLRSARSTGLVRIRVRTDRAMLLQTVQETLDINPLSTVTSDGETSSVLLSEAPVQTLLGALVERGLNVVEVAPERAALDEVFRHLTQDGTDFTKAGESK